MDQRLQCRNDELHTHLDRNGKPHQHEGKTREHGGMRVKKGEHLGNGEGVQLGAEQNGARQDKGAGEAYLTPPSIGVTEGVEIEAEEENERAIHVYKKCGYEVLPYMELKKEDFRCSKK